MSSVRFKRRRRNRVKNSFECDGCNKDFTYLILLSGVRSARDALSAHKQIHERGFKCACGKSFDGLVTEDVKSARSARNALSAHKQIHKGGFKCACGKSFDGLVTEDGDARNARNALSAHRRKEH